ncbi:hypothetical protein J2Z26_000313 [Bacillus luteolus]|nr:hypothetical protein [Cytobacillus luteolus]
MTPAGRRGKVETPQAQRRGGSTSSPRKASAWTGNQRTLLLLQTKKGSGEQHFAI